MKTNICKLSFELVENKNFFMFLPIIWVSVNRRSLYVTAKWFFLSATFFIARNLETLDACDFSLLPRISLYRLDKRFKEQWDFQFFWLWMGLRKFFGSKKNCEGLKSLKEDGLEFCNFSPFKN